MGHDLPHKRDVDGFKFVESTTGRIYPVENSPYLGIESLWNRNYWVNMQNPVFGMMLQQALLSLITTLPAQSFGNMCSSIRSFVGFREDGSKTGEAGNGENGGMPTSGDDEGSGMDIGAGIDGQITKASQEMGVAVWETKTSSTNKS